MTDDPPKAWEDNWQYLSGEWPETVRRAPSGDKVAEVWAEGLGSHDASDLIAAAPDMARLLLQLEWASGPTVDLQNCGSCGAFYEDGHDPGCAWVATMQKAGVR